MESSQTMLLKQQDKGKNVAAKKGASPNQDIGTTNFYFQLVLLVMEIACSVVKKFIMKKVLQGEEFQSFLEQIHIKESIFHFHNSLKCCECSNTPRGQSRNDKTQNMLTFTQLKVLYKYDKEKSIHTKYIQGKRSKACICCYTGKDNIQVSDIDISMCVYVITAANPSNSNIINWIKQITEVRNELFHLSDIKKMTRTKFNNDWKSLTIFILGIAKEIELTYAEDVRKKILDIASKEVSINTSAIPYERLCREYWENVKSIEFESTQEDELVDLERKAFHMSKLSPEDHEKITETIHTLKCQVENTTVNVKVKGRQFDKTSPNVDDTDVSVLLHLEIPPGWDRDNIVQAVSSIRLHGNSAIKINAISCENLNIKINVNSNLLSDPEELKDEFEKTLSTVFEKAGVNTQETSEVNIEFMVPLEAVSKQTVEDQSVQIEVTKKFNIERPRRSSADKWSPPYPHFFPEIVDCILINGRIVLTDFNNSKLLIHTIDGHDNRIIELNGQPRCMSIIRDDHIAVSYIEHIGLANGKVEIIDINNGLENTIENIWDVGCMTYQDGLLFVVINGRNINAMNLKGKIDRSFACPSLAISNISSDDEKMFLTDSGKNKLYCCDLFGRIIWEFKDESMKMPSSVTVDRNHNVYVTGDRSKNVLILSSDGEKLNDLLPEDYGVLFPIIIRYDTANDYLLAYNFYSSDAFLLDIKTFTGACDDQI